MRRLVRAVTARLRWYDLLPEAVLALGLGIFAVTEPDAAFSAFKSGRALAIMVVVGMAWVAARLLTAFAVRWPAARLALFSAAALGVLWVVVVPAYRNDTVVETLASGPVVTAPAPATPSTTGSTTTTTVPQASPTSSSTSTTTPAVTSTTTTTTASTASTTSTTAPAGPVRVRTGSFRGIDHRAEGGVNIYRRADGSQVVGLEDFDIQPGPNYDLYVVPGQDRDSKDGGVKLDDLRGNRGTQFYDVPAAVDVTSGPWTVLVWCQTFSVPVANATPA